MEEQGNQKQPREPHGRPDREGAADRLRERHDYAAGANGEQDVDLDATAADAKDTARPERDGTGW